MSEKRIALVTGASRGIGRAAARLLARDGFRVVCVARAQQALEKLDDQIRADGGEATLVPMDLRDGDSIDRLGAQLYERYGRLDALAACAGSLGSLTPTHQVTPAVMDEVIGVNFTANYRLIRSMHPLLRASDAGRAVFVTSGVASNGRAYWSPYAASKGALEGLAHSYAEEVAITPIRVNIFSPGPTRTAMRAKAFPGEDPMTLPTPEEVAAQLVALLKPGFAENGQTVRFQRVS